MEAGCAIRGGSSGERARIVNVCSSNTSTPLSPTRPLPLRVMVCCSGRLQTVHLSQSVGEAARPAFLKLPQRNAVMSGRIILREAVAKLV